MARDSVSVERRQTWGVVRYDTLRHSFSYEENEPRSGEPYADKPVALNIVVTRRCNMNCRYCVAKGFPGFEEEDLDLTADMIRWITRSDFMLLVLTGGEPLMPPYDAVSLRLIDSVTDQGVILDTNGTFLPSRDVLARLRERRVMVRVSMDSSSPAEEIETRRMAKGQGLTDLAAYYEKLKNMERFVAAGIRTAVQTVVWRSNPASLDQMIDFLGEKGISRWYLQRLIPARGFGYRSTRRAAVMKPGDYYGVAATVRSRARSKGIECVPKMDLRHNSVFLLAGDGALYTQGVAPGERIGLGRIREEIGYFDYVSAADHACRYYLAEEPQEECGPQKRRPASGAAAPRAARPRRRR